MRIIVIAVGRLRPPFADDVQHYQKLLAGHARVELVELRDEEKGDGRLPDRAFTALLSPEGKTFDSIHFSTWMEERRQSGRDLCFVIGGPPRVARASCDARPLVGARTAPPQI